MTRLAEIARSTVAAHGMLPGGAVIVVLVSGGPDSVALLRLLAAGELGEHGGQLSVLHVNHGLRADAADADEMFVARLCHGLDVECHTVRFDVAAYAASEGLNLEDAGRRIRYRFAEDEVRARCEALGFPAVRGRIAVAHTFDDRLETFLARLVTGAGAGGLASIAPVRGSVVRPLIDARRADVIGYLRGIGQEWREDETNEDVTRERAWARHELLPVIERRNPSFASVAARTMRVLQEEDALLGELSSAFARDFARTEDGALVFERAFMLTLSRPMARRVVRDAIVSAFPEASRLTFEHADAVVSGFGEDAFARDLPFGLRAESEYGTIRISRRGDEGPRVAPGLLECPGSADLGPAGRIAVAEVPQGALEQGPDVAVIDADVAHWPLAVDSFRDGDRLRPLGLGGSKKLSDLLTDAKTPKRLRAAVPVVRDGEEIVWVAGHTLADGYKVTATTTRVARLVWYRPDGADGLSV